LFINIVIRKISYRIWYLTARLKTDINRGGFVTSLEGSFKPGVTEQDVNRRISVIVAANIVSRFSLF